MYRIVQEALTNVAKHSQAKSGSVSIGNDAESVWAQVQDHGIGFDPRSVDRSDGSGLGLFGMQERTALFNGKLKIDSARGRGTTVTVRIPLPESAPLDPTLTTPEVAP
jgi:signal transduction histidine kinase